ncbi:MAG: hypothetical protein ACR2O7_07645 [Parasphingorhabdus sp.]
MRFLFTAKAGVALAALTLVTPALANEIESARSFDIAVSGSISQYCAMGSIADMDFGNLERRGISRQTPVAFSCNMPFTMTINGERGALTHTTMPNGQGPFGGQLPYSLSIELPVRHPARQVLTKSFSSRQLQAGGVISSNGGIATDGMILGVELGLPSGEAGLLAGEYSEVITITVSPI